MGDGPTESLRVSNEGILDTIGKGIKAIIKFIMDMLTSAWNFIKGLFGGAKQIESNNEKLKPLNKKELIDTAKFVNIKLKDLQKLEIRVDNNLKNSLEKILSKFEEYKKYLNVTTKEDSVSYSLRKGFYNAMNSIEPTLVYLVKHAVTSETNAIADSITIFKEISKFINFNAKTIANINKAYNK